MTEHEVDVVLIHRGPEAQPMISFHLLIDGERRVFTIPLPWGTLARLVASGARMIADDSS